MCNLEEKLKESDSQLDFSKEKINFLCSLL